MRGASLPFVSVVVPVYNDRAGLVRCLGALRGQSYPQHLYEVIVVDNGSDEPLDSLMARFPGVRLATESRVGAYAARNTGVGHAKGDVLGFTDADCLPAPDWLERGVNHLLDRGRLVLVAGRIDMAISNRPTAFELFDRVSYLRQHEFVERQRFGATANVFTWRDVWDRVGPFDETLKSSGDREWGGRVAEAGYELLYADDVRVTHLSHTPAGFIRRRLRLAGGHHELRLRADRSLRGRLKAVLRAFVPPVRYAIDLARDPRLQRPGERVRVAAVAVVVRYLQAVETLRLTLGGRSRR